MGTALLHARLSKATRAKVGAVLVTQCGVTLTGYNGTPRGTDNDCEYKDSEGVLRTKPETLHAEINCVLKAAREGVSSIGSTIYVSLSPCVPCAAMLIQAGVTSVYYKELYRDVAGVKYLKNNGIEVQQI
jgi:dCMP deaminase